MEDLEITMKLESLPIQETGVGMMQIQSQLDNLMLQLQDIKKGEEMQEELWCIRCRMVGHNKDNYSATINYVAAEMLNLENTQVISWCRICISQAHWSK